MPFASDDLWLDDLATLSGEVRRRTISPIDIVQSCLARIDALDSSFRSFVAISYDQSLAAAQRADTEIAHGRWRGPLDGIPVAVKDLVFTRGLPTTGGSPAFEGFAADRDAVIVSRLKAAGAILVGKLAMTEAAFFAHHPSIDPPKNPWSSDHWTGASSSGPAVALSVGLCAAAVGSDTGGSIRVPASCCGVVGLKPTFGRVSRDGTIPLAETLDHIGPMAPSAFGVAALFSAMVGHDPEAANNTEPLEGGVAGLTIGIDADFATRDVAMSVASAFDEIRLAFEALGCKIRPILFPDHRKAMAAWARIFAYEAWRFHRPLYAARRSAYGPMLARFLEEARSLGVAGIADAMLERSRFRQALNAVFAEVDLVLVPAMPIEVPSLDETERLVEAGETDRINHFTEVFNLSGHPAIVFPAGLSPDNLPIGMQLVGPRLSDMRLCRAVHAFQGATDWHRQRPRHQGGAARVSPA